MIWIISFSVPSEGVVFRGQDGGIDSDGEHG